MKRKISLLLLLVFFSIPSFLSALTLSDIRTEIRVRIKDVGVSSTRQTFSDTQLNNMINEAQRDVVNATWIISKSTTITLAANTTYYAVPDDLIAIQRITDNHKFLTETTLIKLDGESGNSAWKLETAAAPQYYFQDPSLPGYIGVYPFPNSSVSSVLLMNYYSQPTALSSDSDVPFNSSTRFYSYHDVLVSHVCYRIFLLEGEVDKATVYRQEYEARILTIRDRIGTIPNYIPSFTGGSK